jgi:hypothetical protein
MNEENIAFKYIDKDEDKFKDSNIKNNKLKMHKKEMTKEFEEIEYKDSNLNYLININFDNIYHSKYSNIKIK